MVLAQNQCILLSRGATSWRSWLPATVTVTRLSEADGTATRPAQLVNLRKQIQHALTPDGGQLTWKGSLASVAALTALFGTHVQLDRWLADPPPAQYYLVTVPGVVKNPAEDRLMQLREKLFRAAAPPADTEPQGAFVW